MRTPAREHFYLSGEFAKSTAWLPRIHVRFRGARPDDVETEVDLSFRALSRSTKVAFTQGPFKTEERRALHRDGWTDAFDKFERLLSRTAETISNQEFASAHTGRSTERQPLPRFDPARLLVPHSESRLFFR